MGHKHIFLYMKMYIFILSNLDGQYVNVLHIK